MSSNLSKIEFENGFYYIGQDVVVDKTANIGHETKLWDGVRVGAYAKIGSYGVYGAGVHIENNVVVGDFAKVQRGVTLYDGVIADDYVFFGPNATTTNDRNPRAFGEWEKSTTKIGTGASIGANATIIAGNEVGSLSLVGAGAVVSRPVEAGQLVVGNPARFQGWVNVRGEVVTRDLDRPEEVQAMLVNPRDSIQHYLNGLR